MQEGMNEGCSSCGWCNSGFGLYFRKPITFPGKWIGGQIEPLRFAFGIEPLPIKIETVDPLFQ